MRFKLACGWGAMLMLALAGCAQTRVNRAVDVRPAVVLGSGRCHAAIEAAMREMIGSSQVRLSPEAFRTEPRLLLSNHPPAERPSEEPHRFHQSADRLFLLHLGEDRCLLSWVDAQDRFMATEVLDTCACTAPR